MAQIKCKQQANEIFHLDGLLFNFHTNFTSVIHYEPDEGKEAASETQETLRNQYKTHTTCVQIWYKEIQRHN
jgi:hypothetical protein